MSGTKITKAGARAVALNAWPDPRDRGRHESKRSLAFERLSGTALDEFLRGLPDRKRQGFIEAVAALNKAEARNLAKALGKR